MLWPDAIRSDYWRGRECLARGLRRANAGDGWRKIAMASGDAAAALRLWRAPPLGEVAPASACGSRRAAR